jgi:hypothetical protein
MRSPLKMLDEVPESWKLAALVIYTAVILLLGMAASFLSLPTILAAIGLLFIGLATIVTCYKPSLLERKLDEFVAKYEILSSNVKWNQIAQDELQDMLISLESLKDEERMAEVVWILTPDFYYDLKDFQDIVIENLKDGKEYIWLFPSSDRAIASLEHFKKILSKKLGKAIAKIEPRLKFYKIEDEPVPMTETIYNPYDTSHRLAVVMPRVAGEVRYFAKLKDEQVEPIRDQFSSLMRRSKIIPFHESRMKKEHMPEN